MKTILSSRLGIENSDKPPELSSFKVYFPCWVSPSIIIRPSFSVASISGRSAVLSATSINVDIIDFIGRAVLGTEKLSPL